MGQSSSFAVPNGQVAPENGPSARGTVSPVPGYSGTFAARDRPGTEFQIRRDPIPYDELPDGRGLLFQVGDTRLSALTYRGSRRFGDIWTTALNVIRRTPSESDAVDSLHEMVYLWCYPIGVVKI